MKNTDLRTLVDAHQSRNRWPLLAFFLLPYITLLSFDFLHRADPQPVVPPGLAWDSAPPPYPPNYQLDIQWGDLLRMAGLPFYDRKLSSSVGQQRQLRTDSKGFLNNPDARIEDAEVIVAGASFFGAGTSNEDVFANQLERLSGRRTYNAALPGQGPVESVLRILTTDQLSGAAELLIIGVVQRGLEAKLFPPVYRTLDRGGRLTSGKSMWTSRFIRLLRWNSKLGAYLELTSEARTSASRFGDWLPPMALDHGRSSPVQLYTLSEKFDGKPILFLEDSVSSAHRDLEQRGGHYLIEAFLRIRNACNLHSIRLVVLLVPDKFELYRGNAEPVTSESGDSYPPERATLTLERRLREQGVEAIDLYTCLREAQFLDPGTLLYRRDDTHWSDDGIEVAAAYVAEYLRQSD